MPVRVPKYRLHKGSGQALVQINGRRIYLGKHDSPASHEKYRQIIAEWLRNGQQILPRTPDSASGQLSVNELILAYWKYAMSYYVKDGKPTDETHGIRARCAPLSSCMGTNCPARSVPGN